MVFRSPPSPLFIRGDVLEDPAPDRLVIVQVGVDLRREVIEQKQPVDPERDDHENQRQEQVPVADPARRQAGPFSQDVGVKLFPQLLDGIRQLEDRMQVESDEHEGQEPQQLARATREEETRQVQKDIPPEKNHGDAHPGKSLQPSLEIDPFRLVPGVREEMLEQQPQVGQVGVQCPRPLVDHDELHDRPDHPQKQGDEQDPPSSDSPERARGDEGSHETEEPDRRAQDPHDAQDHGSHGKVRTDPFFHREVQHRSSGLRQEPGPLPGLPEQGVLADHHAFVTAVANLAQAIPSHEGEVQVVAVDPGQDDPVMDLDPEEGRRGMDDLDLLADRDGPLGKEAVDQVDRHPDHRVGTGGR